MRKLSFALMVLCLAATLQAALLEWDGTRWPHGSLSQSYTLDGVNLDMAFTGAVSSLITNHAVAYNQALPSDNWNRSYWSPTAPDGLWWGVKEVVSEASPLVLIIQFSAPVTSLTFSLYDLDGSELVYFAGSLSGGAVNPAMVNPGSIAYTPATGRLYGNGIGGDPGSAGNTATIMFEDAVDSLVIRYSGGANSGMMLGNLEFIPEPATLTLLALGAGALLRRRK
jgi:hypothetical protein